MIQTPPRRRRISASCGHSPVFALAAALLLAIGSSPALAQKETRDDGLLRTMEISGLTLDMPAREAFELLLGQGYDAGIERFEDWDQPRLELVLGEVESPEGFNQMQLAREGDRLTNIVYHVQRPRGARFDIEREVNRARGHFNVAADSKSCFAGPTMGVCSVDGAGGVLSYHQTTMAVSRTEQVTSHDGLVGE